MAQSACSELCGYKDVKLGHKGADGAVAGEVHPDGQEHVPGLGDGLGEGHHPAVVVHLPGGEKALLVAAGDGQLHAVPGDDTGGAHAENHGGHLDVGGEREVVVGYSQRQLGALLILMARQALTAAARKVDRETRRGLGPIQQAEKQQSVGQGKRGACWAGPPAAPLANQPTRRAPLTHLWEVSGTSSRDSGTSLFQHPRGALGGLGSGLCLEQGVSPSHRQSPTQGCPHQAHPAL